MSQCLNVVEVQDIKTKGSLMKADQEKEKSCSFNLKNQLADPIRGRMKTFLLAIAAVQIFYCSGVPSTKEALRASVIKLNEITEITNLCGITRRGVIDTYRTGKLSYNVDLTFSVKETVCSKNSGQEFDNPSCFFRPKNIAEKGFCKSHVEFFADKVADVDVECDGLKTVDSESDSTESSETSIEAQSKSKETLPEETSNEKSKLEETALEISSNEKDKSKETSLEDSADIESKSNETSFKESSKMRSKSMELSLEQPSNEQNEDSRAQH